MTQEQAAIEYWETKFKQQADRIAELEKASSKPVAFMNPTALEYKQRATDFMHNDSLYPKDINWIPLYTHPVKQLNDEEIMEIVADKYAKGQGRYADCRLFYIEFARAIIKEITE